MQTTIRCNHAQLTTHFFFFLKTKVVKMTTKTINNNRQKCLPHPPTRMTHCPQYDQKYNTEMCETSLAKCRRTLPQT